MSVITVKDWNDLKKELMVKGGDLPGVYKITRKLDGKVYIGQTGTSIISRIKQHIDNKHEGDSAKIDGAIQAEGWNAFTYEVEEAIPEATTVQLWYREMTLIAKYNSCANGFNKTHGNHVNATFITLTTKHEVSVELTKRIRNHFKLNLAGKKVLLIGFFKTQFIDKLEYDDCTVTQINKVCDTDEEFAEYIMEELKNYMNIKFDLIIANPPYGAPGANITKTIIDTIDYDEYVNLLPANDYKRNDTKDLFKYAELSTMISITGAFKDAAVTTHLARINKKPHLYISWEEFEIENYSVDSLKKYFYEVRAREHYAIDHTGELHKIKNPDANYTFYIGGRDINHKHLPWKNGKYTEDTLTYQWNIEKIPYAAAAKYSQKHAVAKGELYFYGNTITFATTVEKDNFTNFVYDNRLFINKLFTAVQADGRFVLGKIFPKVDWTRSWTVEEILKDYGYTQKEIDEVIADLDNFKGMED